MKWTTLCILFLLLSALALPGADAKKRGNKGRKRGGKGGRCKCYLRADIMIAVCNGQQALIQGTMGSYDWDGCSGFIQKECSKINGGGVMAAAGYAKTAGG